MAQQSQAPHHPAPPVHPVDEKPAAKRLVPAALQHIAAMYAGVVTPPLIIGQAVGLDPAGRTRLIAAGLLIAGLATLLQTLGIRELAGNRLPFVNAASSAGITRGFLKQIALLIGLVVGTLAAIPFGMASFDGLRTAPIAALPTPFAFGAPEFQPAAILSLCLVMLVLMTESSAGMLALGEICDRPATGATLTRGLRTDGLATLLGPVFGGFPTSAFAQNVGVVSLTRVRSRYVVALAGGMLLVLGAFPVLGAVVSLVPMPALGGAGIVLFGSIAVSGIRTLSEAGLDDSSNIILVAVSLGAGIIPLAAPTFYADFPAWAQTVLGSGISAGALVAVLLNLFFHHLGTRSTPRAAVLSAASPGSGTQIP
ncbi:solute carrier family 23 protein [Streptomyces sp. MS1.AVA.3]|uniref:solute carrier family 23 protein n=1 Tax=Streptomyces decoyicus TaxID=249567 RepID=UPI0030C64CCD